MRFQKHDLLDHFARQDRVYRVTLLASHWLGGGNQYTPSAGHEARTIHMQINGRWIPFADLADKLEDQTGMIQLTSEFSMNQLHALIRAPFELLNDYCEDFDAANPATHLVGQLKSTSWYQFARHIRNAISHNFRYEFREKDRKDLPIVWNGITLSETMHGQAMSYEFGHRPGYMLFLEMRDFAEALPEVP